MEKYICIHGHFYQPPRENAGLDEVEVQDSAYPYHDWNERITAECYAPNTASRIVDANDKIIDIINNYSKISFNIGPTLLLWMEKQKPEIYEAILEADKLSRQNYSGHGSAIAQVYNHMIMPLANRQDKFTQVYWGIKDFIKRFKREPEGMWLPEAAVNLETLEILAGQNIKFTILAPNQAKRTKHIAKGGRWHDVKNTIDPKKPYICYLPSGKSITLFFYDGPISQDIAFGGLLNDGESFAKRLLGVFSDSGNYPQLVQVATDGESYGHHHKYGEMALSYCLHYIQQEGAAKLTNYGEYLGKHPPEDLVEISENTSWSCFHGIERWRENCGCNAGAPQGWTQAWRKPLRETFDYLRDKLVPLFEQEATKYLKDPWQARNEYIEVLQDRSIDNIRNFLDKHSKQKLSPDENIKVLKLLNMQHNCMLMYTSCGWFFNEISGIETTQVMQYAAKAIHFAEDLFNVPFEDEFLKKLAAAPSNIYENGARVYENFVEPAKVDLLRVAAHYGISSIFIENINNKPLYSYTVESEAYTKKESGKFKLAIGKVKISPDLTWEEKSISYAALHLGDHNITAGVRIFINEQEYNRMLREITDSFGKGNITEVIQLLMKHFGNYRYSLWHLFKEEQRRITNEILSDTLNKIEVSFREIYEENFAVMNFLHEIRYPIPTPFSLAAEYIINSDLKKNFHNSNLNLEKLQDLIEQTNKFSFKLDKEGLQYVAGKWIISRMEILSEKYDDISLMERVINSIQLLETLGLQLDLWKAQNIYFIISKTLLENKNIQAEKGDINSQKWINLFKDLGAHLHIKIE